MINAIKIANEGAYDTEGICLDNLKKVNFIFGPNGSGKTTISRVIEGSGTHPDCEITWAAGAQLETRVYNRDFVKKHFDTHGSIKGIYTLGDENVDAVNTVAALKTEAENISNKLKGLKKNLYGEDGQSGKDKERKDLDAQIRDDVWKAKRDFDDLKNAFKDTNNNKEKFLKYYKHHAENNKAYIRDLSDIRADYERIFSSDLSEAQSLPKPDCATLVALESAPILEKKSSERPMWISPL